MDTWAGQLAAGHPEGIYNLSRGRRATGKPGQAGAHWARPREARASLRSCRTPWFSRNVGTNKTIFAVGGYDRAGKEIMVRTYPYQPKPILPRPLIYKSTVAAEAPPPPPTPPSGGSPPPPPSGGGPPLPPSGGSPASAAAFSHTPPASKRTLAHPAPQQQHERAWSDRCTVS